MSFSGPTAPPSGRAPLAAELRLLARAGAWAAALTAIGLCGLFVTTAPPRISLLLEPLSLLLFPGYLLESLNKNQYAFSKDGVLWLTAAFYFSAISTWLLTRRASR